MINGNACFAYFNKIWGIPLRHWRAHWCNLFGCVPVPQNLLAFGAARRCMRSPKPPAYLALPIAAPPPAEKRSATGCRPAPRDNDRDPASLRFQREHAPETSFTWK